MAGCSSSARCSPGLFMALGEHVSNEHCLCQDFKCYQSTFLPLLHSLNYNIKPYITSLFFWWSSWWTKELFRIHGKIRKYYILFTQFRFLIELVQWWNKNQINNIEFNRLTFAYLFILFCFFKNFKKLLQKGLNPCHDSASNRKKKWAISWLGPVLKGLVMPNLEGLKIEKMEARKSIYSVGHRNEWWMFF